MEYAPSKNKLYRGDISKRLMEKILYQKTIHRKNQSRSRRICDINSPKKGKDDADQDQARTFKDGSHV